MAYVPPGLDMDSQWSRAYKFAHGGQIAAANAQAAAAKASADAQRDVANTQKAVESGRQAAENQRATLAAQTARLPEENRMARFNQIFPLLQGSFGQLGQQGAMTPGGAAFPATSISTQNPWSVGQTQQAVNASRAFGNKQLGTQLRSMREGLGARGYGANSALSQALGNQMQMGSLANQMNQARGIRENAAQQNVGQRFRTDTLREQQRAAMEEADIKRRTPVLGQQSQLLSALAGLI